VSLVKFLPLIVIISCAALYVPTPDDPIVLNREAYGLIFDHQKPKKAEDYLKHCLDVTKKKQDSIARGDCHHTLAYLYLIKDLKPDMFDRKKAAIHLNAGLKIFGKKKHYKRVARTYREMAILENSRGSNGRPCYYIKKAANYFVKPSAGSDISFKNAEDFFLTVKTIVRNCKKL
jgi:hypothetical protein